MNYHRERFRKLTCFETPVRITKKVSLKIGNAQQAASALQKEKVLFINVLRKGLTQEINHNNYNNNVFCTHYINHDASTKLKNVISQII